jgi:hypothetical protein
MINIKFNTGTSLAKWSYLMISLPPTYESFDPQSIRAIMNEFYQALVKIGINAAPPFLGQCL